MAYDTGFWHSASGSPSGWGVEMAGEKYGGRPSAGQVFSASNIYTMPLMTGGGGNIMALVFHSEGGGTRATSDSSRLGIYAPTSGGFLPSTLLFQTDTFNANASNLKVVSVAAYALNSNNIYWLAFASTGWAGGNQNADVFPLFGIDITSQSMVLAGLVSSWGLTGGGLPSTFPTDGTFPGSNYIGPYMPILAPRLGVVWSQ